MNKNITNVIRLTMDELLPPFLRNSKTFMYPLFYIWYRGENVDKLMEFKNRFYELSEAEYAEYYQLHKTLRGEGTDMSRESLQFVKDHLGDDKGQSIIDVGCGNGYMLKQIRQWGYTNLSGSDIVEEELGIDINFKQGNIENLPFADNEFDVVICNHTIEHVLDPQKAVSELKRIAKKRLILTTPVQRFSKYTFDLHLNFFPIKSYLLHLMKIPNNKCVNNKGDWSFVGYLDKE